MKHFEMIGRLNVKPLLEVLPQYEPIFKMATFRQDTPGTPHKDTESILLRMPPNLDFDAIFNSMVVTDWATMDEPEFVDAVKNVARLAYAEPARAMIVRLLPGGHIAPHVDTGDYADATDRYHLCLTTNEKCWMRIADEMIHPQPEEVWLFDKHAEHEVGNAGETPRLHLIVDCWKD